MRGQTFQHMNSRQVAEMGVARTFQNLALFKGMSVLDNIMTGRNLKMQQQPVPAGDPLGRRPSARRSRSASVVERIIDFLEIQAYRKTPVGRLPYGLQKRVDLGRALAMEPQVLLLDEPMAGMNVEEKQDMSRFILDVNDEFGTTIVLIEHDMGVVMDISRPRRRARLRQEDRRRHAGRGARRPGRDQRLPRDGALMGPLPRNPVRRPDGRHALFADRARLRADLQGLAACSTSRRARWCCSRRWRWRASPSGSRS